MLKRSRQAGDTLIEVLFAVTVFSFVMVGSLTIMNQGTATSQRSLEITLVRQQIDAQAEALRLMHDSYVAAYKPGITYNLTDGPGNTSPAEEWYKMATSGAMVNSASAFGATGITCPDPPTNAFIIDTNALRFETGATVTAVAVGDTFAQVLYDGSGVYERAAGIWVEGVRSNGATGSEFIDFHIRGCWDAPGLSVPMTLATIVRLYEP